ncbi:MAG: hypothetical protein ACM3IK_16160, partial [Sphingomonadaceae bacterium]
MSLKQLLQILRARAGLVLFITCVVLGGVTAVTLSLPKRYEAEAGVLVNPMGTSRLGDTDSPGSRDDPTATQADIISGYGVALRVVGSLGLTRRPEAIRLVTGAGPLRNLQVLLSHVLPGRAPRRPESLDDWLATQLLKKLQVRANTGSRVVKVAYSSTDPAFAAEVANAFVQAYLRSTAQVGTEPAERTAKLFDQQLASLRQRLQEAEERVSDYERKSHLVSDGQGIDAETTRLSDLSSELVRVQSREYEARAKQRRLERFIGNGAPESDAPPEVLESPAVQESRQQVVQAQADLSALSRRVGPNHPLFVGAEAKLRRARAAYRQQMLAVARGL